MPLSLAFAFVLILISGTGNRKKIAPKQLSTRCSFVLPPYLGLECFNAALSAGTGY